MYGATLYATGGFTTAGGDAKARGIACYAGCTPLRPSTTTAGLHARRRDARSHERVHGVRPGRRRVGFEGHRRGELASASAGQFTPASCTLAANGSCSVSYSPGAVGAHPLSISYAGSSEVAAKSTTASLAADGSNSFEIDAGATCSGACTKFKVKADFDSVGTVVVDQAKPGMATKVKPLIKKLTKSVKPEGEQAAVKLTPAGKQALRANGKLVVKVSFTFTPTGGVPKSQVRKFTVKPPN